MSGQRIAFGGGTLVLRRRMVQRGGVGDARLRRHGGRDRGEGENRGASHHCNQQLGSVHSVIPFDATDECGAASGGCRACPAAATPASSAVVLVRLLESLDLHFGLVLGDAVGFLDLSRQLVALAGDHRRDGRR